MMRRLSRHPTVKRVLRLSTLQLCAAGLSAVAQVAYLAIMARRYSPAVVGAYGLAVSYISVFSAISSGGMSTLVYRETASDVTVGRRYYDSTLLWRILLAAPLLLGSAFLFLGLRPLALCFSLVVAGSVTNYLTEPATAFLNGQLRFLPTAAAVITQRVAALGLLILLPAAMGGSWTVGVSYALPAALTSLWTHVLANHGIRVHLNGIQEIPRLLRRSWPLALAAIGDSVVLRATTLLLGVTAGVAAVGRYTPIAGVTFGLGGIIFTVITPIVGVVGRRVTRHDLIRLTRLGIGVTFVMLGAVTLVQPLLPLAYTLLFTAQPTSDTLLSFRLLTFALIPLTATLWNIMLLQLLKAYREIAVPALSGAAALLVLGPPLMIRYGTVGAGLTALIAESLRCIMAYVTFRSRLGRLPPA